MNGVPRKPKNPLLSAAGFPYENYAENALLVPVTPATPAVLRDDAELDNFVGQEPVDIQPQVAPRTHEDSATNASSQPKESKDTANQPARQGYFTSILSSLPNLSLSSIKTDPSGAQIGQPVENIAGAAHESNPYISSQGRHGSQPEIPGSLAFNPQDSRSADLSGFAAFGPTGASPNPSGSTQPAVPPSLPQVGDAPVSYRLGNQRRLKYAPPPDLTSSNAKPSPTIQTFFPAQNVSTPPTILNPYGSQGSLQSNTSSLQQISSSPEQLPSSEQLSRNSSLHSSFRSSPVATGTAYDSSVTPAGQNPFYETSSVPTSSQFASSSSRPIPSRVLEPATPQNTPANISFPSFVPYANRDLPPTSNLDRGLVASKSTNQLNSPPELSKGDTFGATAESAHKVPLILGKTGEAAFTPISAAKVTEKLEHLLAERKENSPFEVASTEASSRIGEVTSGTTTELAKSVEVQSEKLQATNEPAVKSCETKIDDVQEKTAYPRSNTLSDVFLGQETVAKSVSPKVYTVDDNPVLTNIHTTAKSIAPSPQQYYQFQPTSIPSSACCANKPADQKPIFASSVQFPHQSSFYSLPKTSEVPFAGTYFESAANNSDQFSKLPFQESNANTSPFGQPTVDATSGTQLVQENPVFTNSAAAVNSTPFWSADQSLSRPQRLDVASGQPVYTSTNQPPPPIFYNPADFANELSKRPTLSHTHDQRFAQQGTQQYQNQSFYEGTKKFQDLHVAGEINTAHPLIVVPMATAPEPTGSATLSPTQMSANSLINRTTPDTVSTSSQNLASGFSDNRMQYRAMHHHWFYRKEIETKTLWLPFSMQDSLKLEEVHNSSDITPETTVATDGGRYDVDILRRQRAPVYWTGTTTEVRRCSWFFKGATESRYVPYDESTAVKLEEEYKQACLTNNWNRRVELSNGEYVVFHSMTEIHYLQPVSPEMTASWGNSSGSEDSAYLQGSASRMKVVKRGFDEFNIDEGEPENVDHLLFLVHGIGSVCDLKFRTVEEVVDEFRSISLQLVNSHYHTACEQGIVNRIEVLPISWHTTLHSDDTGIDKKLQAITLESIPKLRHFTNDTLLDILFYTSPVYCQTIMQTVGTEINKLHALFKDRNPNFNGEVYLGGHSLGSLILFDLLCHQKPPVVEEPEEERDSDENGENDSIGPIKRMPAPILRRRLSKRVSYVMGAAGTGQPYIHYPQLNFHPRAFFALGSPIGMFVTVRGIDTLGEDFAFPTCPAFFNIFHPYDPVAYRMESLINPEAYKFRPMLIPHHKGRKRIHLELKETMARVGAELKQKLIDSVRSTWNSVYHLALFHRQDNQALELEIDKVVEEQLQKSPSVPNERNNDDAGADLKIGKLNGGRRIDYVLQEAPFEYINEYIFALTSHICYWESEDTMLLMLKEVYGSKGIQTDAQLPQQTMSIERVSTSSSLNLAILSSPSRSDAGTPSPVTSMDPMMPISQKPVGPPPKTGFVRKS